MTHLDKAEALLADFGRVWQLETAPGKRARLVATLHGGCAVHPDAVRNGAPRRDRVAL